MSNFTRCREQTAMLSTGLLFPPFALQLICIENSIPHYVAMLMPRSRSKAKPDCLRRPQAVPAAAILM